MKTIVALLALAAVPWLASAQAQTVWRCGPDGSSYSATPCTEGRALALSEARPAADVQAALALAARERQAAEQSRRERLRTEAQTLGSGLTGIALVKAPAATGAPRPVAKRHPKARPALAADGTWTATAPLSR